MMEDKYNLKRFIEAQEKCGMYEMAVNELSCGRKCSHWIWFVFPQMKGLGYSHNSNYYGITCREEAEAYLADDLLNERLRNVCSILMEQVKMGKSAREILGGIDAKKVQSCLTLFDAISPKDIFMECLEVCYRGNIDAKSLKMLAFYRG